MESFHGTLLSLEGQTLFDHIGIHFQSHTTPDGSEVWSGYFELPTARGVITGERFRLVLEDGREREIMVDSVEPPRPPRVLFETTDPQS